MTERNIKIIKSTSVVLLLVLIFLILKELQSFLIPIFLAFILYFLFEPLHSKLQSKKIPASVSLIIIILIIIIVINLISVFIYSSINGFYTQFPVYEQKLFELVNSVLQSLSYSAEEIINIRQQMNIQTLFKQGSLTGFLTGFFSGALGILGNGVLILIFFVFLILEMPDIRKRIRMAYSKDGKEINETFSDVFTEIKQYIISKTILGLIQGILFTIVLLIFGVDFAFLWGFFTFLADYIPNIGSIVATSLPFLTALVQFDNILYPLLILAVLTTIQFFISNIVEPKFLGSRLNLSPLIILISLIFWGYIWGVIGMILAVPILSIMKIIFSRFDTTRPISIMISNLKKGESKRNLFSRKKS